MDNVLFVILNAVTWAVAGWTLNTAVHARRRRRLIAEQAAAEATTTIIAAIAALEARLGVRIAMAKYAAISPDEIRNGDRIHWISNDGEDAIDYTAGYHGDTGNQTGGRFYRTEWERDDHDSDDR